MSDPASPVVDEANRIAALFDYPAAEVNRGVEEFIREMNEGLQRDGTTLSQIPSYITAVPDGTEKGLYLAVDLGGTNFRVCSITLNGDSTFSMEQSKSPIPRDLMVTKSAQELFSYLALQIEKFLTAHLSEHYTAHPEKRQVTAPYREDEIFDLGFTFSFPVLQHGINQGNLLRWTKGFDIAEAVGQDVCKLLQDAIDERHLPVRVAALINDTVGTLMARSYCSPGSSKALIGAIFGTGTNGAYVEKLDRVAKLTTTNGAAPAPQTSYDTTTGEMVVNTEWGSFDNPLAVLPTTPYDAALDAASNNPGIQMFEKRISGMFLGEILRRALLDMATNPAVNLFDGTNNSKNNNSSSSSDSPLHTPWGIDTSFLSTVKADHSPDLSTTHSKLQSDLAITNPTPSDCRAVKILVHAIGKRAARLSAVALAAIIISTGKLENNDSDSDSGEEEMVDIGVDGSVVEHYPGFEGYLRQAFREIPQIGEKGESRISIGVAKDGSGVGAALGALVAREAAVRRGF
ncbi:glucokinase [Onygenales sp. PD_12]|nr:glucokinase [Onygenales sp. PD_12]